MAKFRKKPVVIEAKQVINSFEHLAEIADWCSGMIGPDGGIYIKTLEGEMYASINDYIIKGIKGEFYPCKPDIFEATYEEVN